MFTDLTDHPFHPANVAAELGDNPSEQRWLDWARRAERLLGHDLDGNDPNCGGDGYSLDEASDFYGLGWTPEDYVREVQSRGRYRVPA